ncbi:hypothetical protein O3P69_017117 [Scylla paramamosain]|uniref:Large ribosomal subunit protein bL36m n=2 Tax=Scylla TaxID=6760 RepID=A0A0P4WEU9_SCYOL
MNFLSLLCRGAPAISRIIPSLEQAGYAFRPLSSLAGQHTFQQAGHIFRSLSSLTGQHTLLQPTTPSLVQVSGMKQKVALRRRCKDCMFVSIRGRLHVLCKAKPRHNQRAIQKKEKNTWILSHATQSIKRPW